MNSFLKDHLDQTARLSNHRNKKSSHLDQVDFRDRFVPIDLPEFKDGQIDKKNSNTGLENSPLKF